MLCSVERMAVWMASVAPEVNMISWFFAFSTCEASFLVFSRSCFARRPVMCEDEGLPYDSSMTCCAAFAATGRTRVVAFSSRYISLLFCIFWPSWLVCRVGGVMASELQQQ